MKKAILRLLGVILFTVGVCVMITPFFFVFLFFGIDKANIVMSYAMRFPMNWIFDDNMGSDLLDMYKEMEKLK